MGEDKGSRMRDRIGRRDLLEILPSTVAAANPGARNARRTVACGAFQGAKTVGEDTRWLSRPPRSPSEPHSPHQDGNRLRITMRPSAITNSFPAVLGPCSSGRSRLVFDRLEILSIETARLYVGDCAVDVQPVDLKICHGPFERLRPR
jgi:hypothetical protein